MAALEEPRVQTDDVLRIWNENPHGPEWGDRLAAALRREYLGEWIGPCMGERAKSRGMSPRAVWWVRV